MLQRYLSLPITVLLSVSLASAADLTPKERDFIKRHPRVFEATGQMAHMCMAVGDLAQKVAVARETIPLRDAYDRLMALDPNLEQFYMMILGRIYVPEHLRKWQTLDELKRLVYRDCEQQMVDNMRAAGMLGGQK